MKKSRYIMPVCKTVEAIPETLMAPESILTGNNNSGGKGGGRQGANDGFFDEEEEEDGVIVTVIDVWN